MDDVVEKPVWVSDYTKPSLEILSDLIMQSNGLESGHVPLHAYDMTRPENIEGVKVAVSMTAKRGSGFKGQQHFTYNRVNLNQVTGIETMGVDAEALVERLSDVLVAINARFGLNLQPDDVLVNGVNLEEANDTVVQEFDVVQDFSLTARPGSFVWVGDVAFTLTKIRQALNEVYQVTLLDGLYAPLMRATGWVLVNEEGYIRKTEEGYLRVAEDFSPEIVDDITVAPEPEGGSGEEVVDTEPASTP